MKYKLMAYMPFVESPEFTLLAAAASRENVHNKY
jgi:hypothetical protein